MRHADELPVGEHHAGTHVAVVENDVDALSLELFIETVGGFAHGFALRIVHRADHHFERGDGVRPDDAALVVTLLDGSAGETGHADAVAAHLENLRLAVFIEIGGVEGFGVLRAKVEDVTDFNAALQAEHALAVGRGVALDDVAQVGNLGFGQVAAEVHAGVVIALFIGAAAEVGHVGDGQVCIDGNVFLDADRAEIAGLGTEVLEDLGVGREAEAVLELRQMTGLDFVEVVVGTEQDEDDLGGKRIALFVSAVGGKHDALDGLFKGNA